MKYPQLVSARAVSAISDWLISRLEDLGVDPPVVYSRLLLSLLHTPLQVNALDLADIPQLKGWLTRKNRRLTPPDAEALKKFAAVESLMEVASSDQQKSNVEDLVNELCKRLREIENQNSSDYDEESVEMEAKKINDSATKTSEDPTKRYYRAFPALSSNREETTEAATMSSSALTWPNQAGGGGADEGPEAISDDKTATITPGGSGSNASAGVKRKNKRRRNNGLSKGKSSTFTRRTSTGSSNNAKTPLWDTDFSGNWEMGHDMIRDFIIRQNNRNRSISESDASKFVKINDFMQSPAGKSSRHSEGERKMDQILLKECRDEDFKLPHGVTVNEEQTMLIKNMLQSSKSGAFRKESLVNFEPSQMDEEVFLTDRGDMSPFFGSFNTNNLLFGNNLIRDEGYATPDTLTSMSEVESTSAPPPRRLYEREVSNESLNSCLQAPKVTKGDDDDNIAQFEAKFNKSMEALWDNSAPGDDSVTAAATMTTTTTQDDAKANSFWNSYYSHHYDEEIPKNVVPLLLTSAPDAQEEDDSGWPTKIPSLNDMMVEARKNCSNTDLHAIWAAPDTAVSSASSSQASRTTRFPPEPEMNVMGYPLSDFIGLSKWSEQPFACDDESRRVDQFYEECKSLPITYANYSQAFTPGASFGAAAGVESAAADAQDEEEEEVNVSLMNHSKESRFAVVKKSRHPGHVYHGQSGKFRGFIGGGGSGSATAENENLLTSEKTHFRPIKQTFVDGFIFDIPCTPDNIRYERTESGSMYFDSEKYMEYIRHDEHVEEQQEDAAKQSRNAKKLPNFTLKFCVRQIEKYSQTEDRLLCLSARIFTEPAMAMLRCRPGSEEEDSDVDMTPDIFSRHFDYGEDSSENCDDLDLFRATSYLYQSSASGGAEASGCFGGGGQCVDVDNWTMAEMKKNCVENNNGSHTLWGHCSTCNNSTMSLPANRLLRDELCADGDEILSDLRYMQNLYIGEVDDDDSEWDDEENEEDDEEEMDEAESLAEAEDPAKDMYYNVNKLISDLLRPETVKTLTQVLGEKNQKSILEGILQEKEVEQHQQQPFWRDTWTYSGTEFANSSFWPVSSSTRWQPVNLDKNLNEPGASTASETMWSDWKENQVMDREEISYNLSDDHFRTLMRASPVDNAAGTSAAAATVTRVRPDRKRRHSASQNLSEDFSAGYRNKFHANSILQESWDNFDHLPSESVFRPVHPEGKTEATAGRSALNASSLFNRVTMVSRPLTR